MQREPEPGSGFASLQKSRLYFELFPVSAPLCPGTLFFPCLFRLTAEEITERLELLHTIPRLERFIIGSAILLVDDDRRMVVLNQKIIHRQPAGSAVSIRKWVDILKLRVEICCGRQGISICNP